MGSSGDKARGKRKPSATRMVTKTELKRRDVAALLMGGKHSEAEIAAHLDVSKNLVYTVRKLIKEGKDLAPKKQPGGQRKRTAEFLETIEETYKKDPMVDNSTSIRIS